MDQATYYDDQCLDTFRAMLSQESQAYLVHDTLSTIDQENVHPQQRLNIFASSSQPPVDSTCRYLMASWCNDLCDFCHYNRDLAAMTMINVDRYTSTPQGYSTLFDRERYQLCVMAAFYLGAKITQPEALDPQSVASLSKGKMTRADIEQMEMDILVALKWRVNPPTALTFAEHMFESFPAYVMDSETKSQLLDMTKVQLEASTTDYKLCLHRPSRLAFGAVLNALECLDAAFAMKFESMMMMMMMTSSPAAGIMTTTGNDKNDCDVSEICTIRTGLLVLVSKKTGTAGLPEPWQELLIKQKRSSSSSSSPSIRRKKSTTSYSSKQSSSALSTSPRSIVSSFMV